MNKPKITKSGISRIEHRWKCAGEGVIGLGFTPFYAYMCWRRILANEKVVALMSSRGQ